jgi:hypothetical protein
MKRFAVDVDNGFEPYYVTTERGSENSSRAEESSKGRGRDLSPPMKTAKEKPSRGICWSF